MSRFSVTDLALAGLKLLTRQRIGDARGFLSRLFCAEELASAGWDKPIAQINHTLTSRQGTVRGMHYQNPPSAEMKLVTCIRGEVWDVAVDLRPDSPTYLKWHAERLSADNLNALLLPEGFAHGFQSLTPNAELIYLHSSFYSPELEAGLNPNDPALAVAWPIAISEISDRDQSHPKLTNAFSGIEIL